MNPINRKKLLVSFSAGETSGKMAADIKAKWSDEYELAFVIANTGREKEESLVFANKVDEAFDLNLVWVEADVRVGVKESRADLKKGFRKCEFGVWQWERIKRKLSKKGSDLSRFSTYGVATKHKIVSFKTASRKGQPFEAVIKKYGLPNPSFLHCTRELKMNPIHSYIRNELKWKDYYTAIGIRADETDRIDANRKEKKYIYPFINPWPTTKPEINHFWKNEMPFRLGIKSYEGNCKKCFKKTLRKLLTIEAEERERGEVDTWDLDMERKYENHKPESQENRPLPIRFNRKNLSIPELIELSKGDFERAVDESVVMPSYDRQEIQSQAGQLELDLHSGCIESCEPF